MRFYTVATMDAYLVLMMVSSGSGFGDPAGSWYDGNQLLALCKGAGINYGRCLGYILI